MYKLIISLLFFFFTGEQAHNFTKKFLIVMRYIPGAQWIIRLIYNYKNPVLEREVFGIKFKNPVGLAAGFDKDGEIYNDLANFGFGFVEIGSITPQAQDGNAKPRVFRLPADHAIINRMGINNKGVKYAVGNLTRNHPKCVIGGNISKSAKVSNEDAPKDYEKSFAILYDFVDYFAVNVSCPNVKDLCKLQDITALSEIIDRLLALRRYFDDYRPILLKISPDIPREHLDEIIDLVLISGLDGIIATNTTQSRDNLKTDMETVKEIGNGGLSGAPLFEKSLETVKYINKKTDGLITIIAVGGIETPQQAEQMLKAGASLVQIYSGFIYEGPGLVKRINKHLSKVMGNKK